MFSHATGLKSPKDMGLIVPCLTRREFVHNFTKLHDDDLLCSELVCYSMKGCSVPSSWLLILTIQKSCVLLFQFFFFKTFTAPVDEGQGERAW
jgi:hypothetical protein